MPVSLHNLSVIIINADQFPDGTSGKEHSCQFRIHKRHAFMEWLPIFLTKTEGKSCLTLAALGVLPFRVTCVLYI